MVEIKAYKGSELLRADVAMRIKMWATIVAICLAIQSAIFLAILTILIGPKSIYLLTKIQTNYLLSLVNISNQIDPVLAKQFLFNKIPAILIAFIPSCAAYKIGPKLHHKFQKHAEDALSDRHIRGRQLVPWEELRDKCAALPSGNIRFGPITLPREYETRHTLIAGITGSGKTVCIDQSVERLRPSEKAVIYNFKGDFLEKWYDPSRDIIINPLDARGTGWSIFNETNYKHDVVSVCSALFPAPYDGKDPFWANSAAAIFRGIYTYLQCNGYKSNKDIFALATSGGMKIKDACLATEDGAQGAAVIENPEDRQARACLSNMNAGLGWLEFATDGNFSIKEWIDRPGGGFIFLSGMPELEDTLRPMYSLFFEIFAKCLLSHADQLDRRIYIILDEIANLQRLPSLTRLLTAGRSKGVSVIIGAQEFAGIKALYGPTGLTTIFNCCASTLCLTLKDPESVQYIAKTIGQRQISKNREGHSMAVADERDGISETRDEKIEDVVLASEIADLKTFEGFLLLPDCSPTKIKLEHETVNKMTPSHPAFVLKSGYEIGRKNNLGLQLTDIAITTEEDA